MRAQFEIMGLAIIVIIISVATFFFLSFAFGPPEDDVVEQFQEEQFSQNMLDALMKTSLDGCSGTIADLITWELTSSSPRNPPAGSICDPASGNRLDAINNILSGSVDTYTGRSYLLQIRTKSNNDPFLDCSLPGITCYGETTCNPALEQTGRPGRQLVSLYPYQTEPAEVVLWICKAQ